MARFRLPPAQALWAPACTGRGLITEGQLRQGMLPRTAHTPKPSGSTLSALWSAPGTLQGGRSFQK